MHLSQLAEPGSTAPLQHGAAAAQGQHAQRPERLPRCSTVSLQTELATPAVVVFSGGTAFNSVAGEQQGQGQLLPAWCM